MNDSRLALFVLLGQTASKHVGTSAELVPPQSLALSQEYDLAQLVPTTVRKAISAAEVYKLFFVFEDYLRELVVEVLAKIDSTNWWDKVPEDVRTEVAKLEETEEAKSWMALGSRDKTSLMTYPQLLRVIDHCWKLGFEDLLRDKTLLQETRALTHLRNTICHMSEVSTEESDRIRQTMRDWFRIVAP